MRPRPRRVPVPRKKGNQGSSRCCGRRSRGRSFRPPVRSRDFAAAIPVLKDGPRDAVTDSVSEWLRRFDVARFQQAVDRLLGYPHEARRLSCRYFVSCCHFDLFRLFLRSTISRTAWTITLLGVMFSMSALRLISSQSSAGKHAPCFLLAAVMRCTFLYRCTYINKKIQ